MSCLRNSIIVIVILLNLQTQAQFDIDGAPLDRDQTQLDNSKDYGNDHIQIKSDSNDCHWDSLRYLTEINSNEADAYPWISFDGLRMYYTHDQDFKYTERPSLDSSFGSPILVPKIHLTGYRKVSCWLTNDELEIFYVRLNTTGNTISTLYYANRNSITDTFSSPIVVQIDSTMTGFIAGPSLTQDKKELYLWNTNSTKDVIIRLKEDSALSYSILDTLNTPIGLDVGPGQLSKDDLTYIVGLGASTKQFYCSNRLTDSSQFVNWQKFKGAIIDNQFRHSHPSITGDEKTLVYVQTLGGLLWPFNDLSIALVDSCDVDSGVISSLENPRSVNDDDFTLYPNPSQGLLRIDLSGRIKKITSIRIYNMVGQLVYSNNASEKNIKLNLDLQSGVYYLNVNYQDQLNEAKSSDKIIILESK
jgi:hypothetical protein